MPWRSWCYVVGTGTGDDPRRVALDPPSMFGTLRLLECMCNVAPEAAEVSIALVEDLGTFGIADVQGPADHLTKVRQSVPWWMVADDVDSLVASLPPVRPFTIPPPPVVPVTETQTAWKQAHDWIVSVVRGTPIDNPFLSVPVTKIQAWLTDPLLIAANISLDNYVALEIGRALGRAL
jgi:hypothetical protein